MSHLGEKEGCFLDEDCLADGSALHKGGNVRRAG